MHVNQKYDDQNDNNVKTVNHEDENHKVDDENEESNHNIITTDHFQNKIE